MGLALIVAVVLTGHPGTDAGSAPKLSWKANLTAAHFPAHLVEVTPRNNFAIIYGCDDAPVTLKLDGSHLAVAYFQSGRRFEITDFEGGPAEGTYVMTIRPEGKSPESTAAVQLRLLNPALGIWALWGEDNGLFTGRKTFIDEAQAKAVKTIRPAQGECSSALGSE